MAPFRDSGIMTAEFLINLPDCRTKFDRMNKSTKALENASFIEARYANHVLENLAAIERDLDRLSADAIHIADPQIRLAIVPPNPAC